MKKLFDQMLRIRMIEEAIAREYAKQEIRCPTHLCIGQEAVAVGICANLTKQDIVFSTHRSHGHYLAKGGNLPAMIAELYGKVTGCSGGIGGSQHLIDLSVNFWGSAPIVASLIPVAVGASLSIVMKKEKRIVVSFFGEAATEEGITWESFNYAALKKLPILFVCENNLYSTNTHIRLRQPDRPIFKIAKAMGLASFHEDGNNMLKVFHLAKNVIGKIRKNEGPAFIEFETYRHREHCGPNFDPVGFRSAGEMHYWLRRDPLRKYDNQSLIEKINREIVRAFTFAKKSSFPTSDQSFSTVYAV